ncbi:large ribosomal RNA subunit accumulation protein YCED homolog 1, chloroplastic [Actinidia eriantha]|uniref:large ribosomal RNA subunit accumulation protein YCED homolog 1, chloroplastic n=1 Tax=Actinidia eriantha TaxID=165200 RepID=UPI00258E7757|nr:large ribosomal RNA subunit accumulation protein YCED homolog 1, chloroplastic [Actinidia eriantha]
MSLPRYGEPTAEFIFSNFSHLLTEEPIQEPKHKNMGLIFGEDELGTCGGSEDDEASINWEDRLYFPLEETTIDTSKYIRDLVHVEITIDALCDPLCKGLWLKSQYYYL